MESTERKHIQVYEFGKLLLGNDGFSQNHFEAAQRFYGSSGTPYFKLLHKGIQFNQFVGAIQIGKLTIEVLPKIDKVVEEDKNKWRTFLIDMLRFSGILEVDTPSAANLKVKSNFILDVYIELFLQECEQLLRRGLVKKYRQTSGNVKSLKGSLQFASHIKENLVHQERFFCRYTTYDVENTFNQILYQAILLIEQINTSTLLTGRISQLMLNFPEMPTLKVSDATFSKLNINRKTEHYNKSIQIARLLLLNYHPDIIKGRENVLALMFDMNKLWELFVLKALRRTSEFKFKIDAQKKATFWESDIKYIGNKILKPDIIVEELEVNGITKPVILDTKWKLPNDQKPSDEDLKQMFAYNETFDAHSSYLIYPSSQPGKTSGKYIPHKKSCHLIFLNILDVNNKLNKEVGGAIVANISSSIFETSF